DQRQEDRQRGVLGDDRLVDADDLDGEEREEDVGAEEEQSPEGSFAQGAGAQFLAADDAAEAHQGAVGSFAQRLLDGGPVDDADESSAVLDDRQAVELMAIEDVLEFA